MQKDRIVGPMPLKKKIIISGELHFPKLHFAKWSIDINK